MIKKCKECNTTIKPDKFHPFQQYCKKCAKTRRNIRHRLYGKNHYDKTYKKKIRTCGVCDVNFTACGTQKYCNTCLPEVRRVWHKIGVKKWRKNNKFAINAYVQNKRKTDVRFAVNARMTKYIWFLLKGTKNNMSWLKMVGYTTEQLIERLYNTMPIDATWQDFLNGKLHIDHIIPVSSFKFSSYTDEQFKQCWALDNLQLLWAKDNLMKSDKMPDRMVA